MEKKENNVFDEALKQNEVQSRALKTMLEKMMVVSDDEDTEETNNKNPKKGSLMKNIMFRMQKWFFILAFLISMPNFFAQSNEGYVPQTIRVKLAPEVQTDIAVSLKAAPTSIDGDIVLTGDPQIDALNDKFRAIKMTRVFPNAGKNETKHREYGLHLWYEIKVDESVDLKSAADNYNSTTTIDNAEPIRAKVLGDYQMTKAEAAPAAEALPMNDPYLSDQWHYNNDGSLNNSIAGSDVNLFKAWEIETGSRDVVVSIVDGGIDVDHEDIAANMWYNEAELNGQDGVDDDFNGYVDDVYGFNFITNTGVISAHDHGTHVAGTVAAVNNNGKGVSGVAGGSGNGDGVRVMSCQVFQDEGGNGNFAAAIVYGADNGAVISQNSWSYSINDIYEDAVLDAIDYFNAEAGQFSGSKMKGGLVVFAAGNDATSGARYPAYYPSALAVASIGPNYVLASYSNYGSWVDITSTGGNNSLGTKQAVLSTIANDNYGYIQGTSMACPHVSGIAALAVSKFGNSAFTSQELKSRVLTGVTDIESYNPKYVGQMGAGLIDAELVLNINKGDAPEKIEDLQVFGASEDFVVLEWNVPIDADDDQPISYAVYWSENNITEDSLSVVYSDVIANDDHQAGDTFTFELSNLEGLTTYYFAVVAIDRWSNRSELSNVVSTTTNEGPEISVDVDTLVMTLDIDDAFMTSQPFNIENKLSGVLRWEALVRDIDYSYSTAGFSYPVMQNSVHSSNASVGLVPLPGADASVVLAAAKDWSYSSMAHFTTTLPNYVVGENDSTIANSMATRFVVEDENGFNLTQVRALLQLDKEDGPAIIEIYKGSQISSENLIYRESSTKVLDGLMADEENLTKTYRHTLKERLLFEDGDIFWVVYHIPSGNLYPIGMYPEASTESSGNCLMSFDQGESWVTIEVAIDDPAYVWAVTVLSEEAPLESFITLAPASGEISGIGNAEVSVNVDATTLINGTYESMVVIESNDTKNRFYKVSVNLTITGQKPILASDAIVDYGNIFYGLDKTIDITFDNSGYGRFDAATMVSSNPDVFIIDQSTLNIPALGEDDLLIKFKPNSIGNHNAVITLTSKNGDVYNFNVFGVGIAPPELQMTPNIIKFDSVDLDANDELIDTLTITNTGEFPLQYGFTNFADDLTHIDWVGQKTFQKYAYRLGVYDYPEDYTFDDISETGIDVTQEFATNGRKEFVEVDLGFDFPYYGENLDKLYLTKRGMLTLDTNGKFNATMSFFFRYNPDGYIGALASLFSMATHGSIDYQRGVGKITFQYTDVRSVSATTEQFYTFQIVLYDNGDIQFVYDKLEGVSKSYYEGHFVAIENRDATDGVLVQSSGVISGIIGPKKIVYIQSPGNGLIKEISPAKGTLLPNQSQEFVLSIDRDKLVYGSQTESSSVLSNDPFNASTFIEVEVDVTKGGAVDIDLSESTIDFDEVYQGRSVSGAFEIANKGNRTTTILNVSSKNGDLKYTSDTNVELKSNQVIYATFELSTDVLKRIDDELIITDSDGETYKVGVEAEIVEAPKLVVSDTVFSETLDPNEIKHQALTLENTGVAPLEYSIYGTSLVYPQETDGTSMVGDIFDYEYKTTFDEKPATHSWFNMENTTKLPFFETEFSETWFELDLPFSFDFYDNTYSSVWIGLQGAVSFDEPEKKKLLVNSVSEMGVDNEVNNMIAAYHAPAIYLDYEDVNQSGVFYQEYSDKLVIEWRQFFNALGGFPLDRQLVMYKDGRIKIQFNSDYDYGTQRAIYGVIGLENEDASNFEQVVYYQKFAGRGVAVEFAPLRKEILEAGESKTYDIIFDATDRYAGEFVEELKLQSTSPAHPEVIIPAKINITGEPLIVISEELSFGEVMLSANTRKYTQEFYIHNEGERTVNIQNVRLDNNGGDLILQFGYFNGLGQEWIDFPTTAQLNDYSIDPHQKKGPYRLLLQPTDSIYLEKDYKNTLQMTTDFGSKIFETDITADYVLPPVATLDKDTIQYIVYDNSVINDKFLLANFEGKSDLYYTIKLDYSRSSKTPSTVVPTSTSAPMKVYRKAISPAAAYGNTVVQSDNDYNRILSHSTDTVPYNAIGFGSDIQFTTATAFVAPEDGFLLSNVQTWYIPYDMAKSTIELEVRVGLSIDNSVVVYTEAFDYSSPKGDADGLMLDFELSEAVSLLPYEQFFLVYTYPLGVTIPQGVNETGALAKTFYIYFESEWLDIQGISGLTTSGSMVRAAEIESGSITWIEFSSTEGIVYRERAKEITMTMYPENTKYDLNEVLMTFETNDPVNTDLTLYVQLRKNQGPELILEDVLSVDEKDTLEVKIPVVDIEGDGVKKVTMGAYDNVEFSYANDTISFTYWPTMHDAGLHSYEVTTTDLLNVSAVRTFSVMVNDVNQAPVVAEAGNIIMNSDEPEYKGDFYEIFTDPDGRPMEFSAVIVGNTDVVGFYESVEGFILTPKRTGFSKIQLTAIDDRGEMVSVTKVIVVNSILSAQERFARQWDFYPNPVEDELSIDLSGLSGDDYVVTIYDVKGAVLKSFQVSSVGKVITTSLGHIESGVYVLEVAGQEMLSIKKLVKK